MKIKIREEKPVAKISKLIDGKNGKPRRGILRKKLHLDLYFVYRKHGMESKINEYVKYRQKFFLLKFYYTDIMQGTQK